MPDPLEAILAADYATGLDDLSLDEVRARRSVCQDVEVGLSFARRVAQGRIDIVAADLARRAGGEGRSDSASLVDRLKGGEMLAEAGHNRPAGLGRLPTLIAPGPESDSFSAEVDAAVDADGLSALSDHSDDELSAMVERLVDVERSLSERRRAVLDRIDLFQADIVRRYRTGVATAEDALSG